MNVNWTEYDIDRRQREQTLQAADLHRLGREARIRQTVQEPLPTEVRISRRTVITAASVLALVLLVILITPASAQAQEVLTPGSSDFVHDYELGVRLGRYYFFNGKYEKAAEQFTRAADSLPDEVYEIAPDYALVFVALGDTQVRLEQYDEALANYEQYIAFNGGEADDLVLATLQELDDLMTPEIVMTGAIS